MPRRPRTRRSRTGRTTLPPRPPVPGAPAPAVEEARTRRGRASASERPQRLVERDAPFVMTELRRIVMISGACLGLLVVLVAVDRLA